MPANHFPTPSVGAGLLLAPARTVWWPSRRRTRPDVHDDLDDLDGAPTTTTAHATSTTGAPAGGAGDAGVTAAFVVGGLAVVGALTWLVVRRRRATRGQ